MVSLDQLSPFALQHLGNGTSVCALLITLFVAYVVVSSVYSLTMHPLATVPGPKLCAISRIPYWIVHMQGKDVRWMHELHKKFGPIVRYGPTDLSCSTGEAWKDINGYRKGKQENGPATEMLMQPVNNVQAMNGATSEDHARVRRLFSPAFSDKALKKQESLFRD
jgi:hypothetical protein